VGPSEENFSSYLSRFCFLETWPILE